MTTVFDITEPKRTEDEVRANEARFRQVLLSISDHIYVTEITQEGERINRYISPHAADLTGYPLDKFIEDWSFWPLQVIHPDDRAAAAAQAALLAKGYDSEVEYRLVRPDGEIIWVRDSGKVVDDGQNETRIIYGVVSDITERKRLEAQLSAIYQLGQELNLLRDEKKIFERVLETIASVLQVNYAAYALVNRETDSLDYCEQLVHGALESDKRSVSLDKAEDIGVAVVQSGQAITIADIEDVQDVEGKGDSCRTAVLPATWPGRSYLSVPIKMKEQVTGILTIVSPKPDRFKSHDRQIMQTLADQAATALENAHLYKELGQRVEELASMAVIGQTITSNLDLDEALTAITNHAVHLFDARSASLVLYDMATNALWASAISGERTDLSQDRYLPLGQGITGRAIEQGEPLLIADTSEDDLLAADLDEQVKQAAHSVLCFPLQTRSGIIGVINVISQRNRVFNQKDLRLLSWLTMPAVTAIENARLFEAQRAAWEQAEILREATSSLTSTLDLTEVLDNILVHLAQVVPYDTACVFLREGDWLCIVAGRGKQVAQKQIVNRLKHPVDNLLYQKIQRIGGPLILKDAQAEPDFQIWEDGIDYVRGWMGVPLTVRSEVIGYLTIDSQDVGAYEQRDADLAQAFANQAAMAIQNAQLFEQVNQGRKHLQSLSRRLVDIQETERRHVARELHDEASQALASLMVGLRLLENEGSDPQAVAGHVIQLKRTTDSVLENLHRLAMDLHPVSLDQLGLVAALRQYVGTFGRQHNLALQFETVGFEDEQRLPSAIEINLYRIVQEALANVARHAQARHAGVLLERRGEHIITIIEDDGVGFAPETKLNGNRLGLLGMRERAEMMDGQLEIESAVGAGTTIYVEIPYANSYSSG